ncbi:MAG: FAD-binding oxidoreductase, partial [Pseudomonadota bacterium]
MKLDVAERPAGAGLLGSQPDIDVSRLAHRISGDVLAHPFDRGRYATDASIYQLMPQAVVRPRTRDDLAATLAFAREEGVSVTARGGGTSQSGQTVGEGLIVDCSRYLNKLISVDVEARTCVVEPGIVLDELNRLLAPHDLWYPIDVSTGSRATIGGMTGNNSCGTRSLRYGIMRDRVLGIEGLRADGSAFAFSSDTSEAQGPLVGDLEALGLREGGFIASAFPEVSRRVGGYNIDALVPPSDGDGPVNLATLLCGSEGTLALSDRITLSLAPRPKRKALGVCHFPTFRAAMDAAQHIVTLAPVAVEVVDRTLIELARDIPMFAETMSKFVRGAPDALLLTEFAEDDGEENLRRLSQLEALMGDLGYPDGVFR